MSNNWTSIVFYKVLRVYTRTAVNPVHLKVTIRASQRTHFANPDLSYLSHSFKGFPLWLNATLVLLSLYVPALPQSQTLSSTTVIFGFSHLPPLILGRFFCHPLCPSNDFQMCLLLASLSPFLPLFLIQLFLILSPFSFLCSTMSKQLVLLFDSHSDVHVGLRSIAHIAEKLWSKFLHCFFFNLHFSANFSKNIISVSIYSE